MANLEMYVREWIGEAGLEPFRPWTLKDAEDELSAVRETFPSLTAQGLYAAAKAVLDEVDVYGNSLSINEYFVVDSTRGDDVFMTWHDTAEAAMKRAESDWSHLTTIEQQTQTISAWRVIQDNIQHDLIDDERPWWEATADRQDLLIKFPEETV